MNYDDRFLPATQNHLLGLGQNPASEKKEEGQREGEGGVSLPVVHMYRKI